MIGTYIKDTLVTIYSLRGPIALFGLSDSFTVGLPSAETALQTNENASNSPVSEATKIVVRLVPQPKDTFTRWAKRFNSSITSSSIREKIMSLFAGFHPRIATIL